MGNELELKEMLDFIYSYNVNSNRNNIFLNQTVIAENYLKRLKTLDKNGYEKNIVLFKIYKEGSYTWASI